MATQESRAGGSGKQHAGGGTHGWAWLPSNPPSSLDEALAILVRSGFVRQGDIDNETRADLKTLPHVAQMQSLIRFQEALLHQKIKSKR